MCTRIVYLSSDDLVITGRSMDWKHDIATSLWVFPRGMRRDGRAGANSLAWTSRFGSVIASGFDISTTDGINEKGLTAQLLWFAESVYPQAGADDPHLSLALWAQYVLDTCASVHEVVALLRDSPCVVITSGVPGEDRLATLHLSVSDASGDSAIFEYIDGKLVIHHGRQFQVMTNSPRFEEQIALSSYWKQIGGTTMLPGTNRSADRFVRASFYISALPKYTNPKVAVAGVFSVIRNVSVPLGITTENEPNISSTRWRTVADQKHLLYFFESATTPNVFWVDLKRLDFTETSGVVKSLALGEHQNVTYCGEVSDRFIPADPFEFLEV